MIQVMVAELRLRLPWVPQSPERIGDLVIRRVRTMFCRTTTGSR